MLETVIDNGAAPTVINRPLETAAVNHLNAGQSPTMKDHNALIDNNLVTADQQFNATIKPLTDNTVATMNQGEKSLALPLPTAWVMGTSGLLMTAGIMLMRSRRVRRAV
jgi:hypothetical protein